MSNNGNQIINKLIWIDAKVNNKENKIYQQMLIKKYKLNIFAFEDAKLGIKALEKIQFESIFVITSGTIYPEFFGYMKRTYEELRVVPFSIIFTSSKKNFIEKHKNDEIGKIYNKSFFNRGGVVDKFDGVLSFINDIYTNINTFKTCNKYEGIYTKDYSGLIVFKKFSDISDLPQFYKDIYKNTKIDFNLLNDFTKFFLVNFCTENIEKLLKPLILFKEVPEVIISKWWARTYTHESPFYSVMNKTLMKSEYKEYESYIRLLYRGLACNSYSAKYLSKLVRGTKLDSSEINYLKSISETDTIIFNKSFLSFTINNKKEEISIIDEEVKKESDISMNKKKEKSTYIDEEVSDAFKMAIAFQSNCERKDSSEMEKTSDSCYIANPPKKQLKNTSKAESDEDEEEKKNLNVLIEITNINESDKKNYIISNAYLRDISYYTKEDEVLIFPFTGFEVIGWKKYSFSKGKDKMKGTLFYFKFSKKFKKLIQKKYDKNNK